MMARPKTKRSEEDYRNAVQAYMRGDLMADIAKRFQVRQPSVSYWMSKYGERFGGKKFRRRTKGRRKNGQPNSRDQSIIKMAVLKGLPYAEVGRKFGITRSRVEFICRTWQERGYHPQPLFKVKDIVKANEVLFEVTRVDDEFKGAAIEVDTKKHRDPFFWLQNGQPVVKVCLKRNHTHTA